MKKPVVFKHIQKMLLKRADFEGKIDRNKLFEIICERIGHIENGEREVLVFELKAWNIIREEDKFSFKISKEC